MLVCEKSEEVHLRQKKMIRMTSPALQLGYLHASGVVGYRAYMEAGAAS